MIGHSLGGALALITATEVPEIYSGVTLYAPYLDLYDRERLNKLLPFAKLIAFFKPTFSFRLDLDKRTQPQSHEMHFMNDPVCWSRKITAHNII